MEGRIEKNILFLSLININSIHDRGIYTDLLREFATRGYFITIVCPNERRNKRDTQYIKEESAEIIKVWTFNIQKTNLIEKGISTLAIEYQFLNAIKKYGAQKYDLVLYATPPITFGKVISYFKKRDNALSYLMLKDIFPQNAVDMGMMKKGGLIYSFFRNKEKQLYQVSDFIGCMSPANVKYVLSNNPKIKPYKVEENPNSIQIQQILPADKKALRAEFGLPSEALILLYGGNLGKPQGLEFLCEILKQNKENAYIHFVIAGSGTHAQMVENCIKQQNINNVNYFEALPKNSYDKLAQSADIGLIFLDPNFTIPNFPSRLLSYLENSMPVIACTDKNSDIGAILQENNAGHFVLSGSFEQFQETLSYYLNEPEKIESIGKNGYNLLQKRYNSYHSYQLIAQKLKSV